MIRETMQRVRVDNGGGALVESLLVMSVLMLLLCAFVELTLTVFQMNLATKALQVGSRLASVSDPVDNSIRAFNPVNYAVNVRQGDKLPIGSLGTRTCTAMVQSDGSIEGTCTGAAGPSDFNASAMRRLVFGGDSACGRPFAGATGMCDVLPLIVEQSRPTAIVVTYGDAGLGYAGRIDGGVPVISVTLANLSFDFLLLGSLLDKVGVTFPPFTISSVGEDLNATHI